MVRRTCRSKHPSNSPSPSVEGLSAYDPEREAFLAALEQIQPEDTAGNETGGDPPTRAKPRRLTQLARGDIQPVETLDLHGLCREEALARTSTFLGHAARQSWPAVILVTGKGLHSPTGPILRQAVEELLLNSPHLVMEWAPAPKRYGGAGALVVFPRHGKS